MPHAIKRGQFLHHGRQLAYELHGSSGAPCVLVHGILLDGLINHALVPGFVEAGYQVVLLDLLGHGRSEPSTDPKDHRTDFYADQVAALLDHLGWDKALVGGMSLGCLTALQVAVRHPNRVQALYLEMPVMEWSMPWAAFILSPILFFTRYATPIARPLHRLIAKLPRPRNAVISSGMNAFSGDPRVVAAILHGVLVGPIAPSESERRHMDVPALVIGHGGDRLHAYSDAADLARQLPQGRLVNARHILELRINTQRLWPEIAEWLEDVRGGFAASKPRLQKKR